MARPEDPNSKYRVSLHISRGYRYASTQPYTIDPITNKKNYRHIHWGTIDESLKFTPGKKYIYASLEERSKLIFPTDWDISAITKLSGQRKSGRPAYEGDESSKLYGDIWLLEQIAAKTGIRADLEKVFAGNREIVDDIMTLAFFPYLTKWNYNRVARWQRIARAPSNRILSPSEITYLTQSITEKHRMALLRLRAAKLGKGEICAVDSTTRSAYGSSLADIRWGKNKERLPLEQTTEVVVYALTSHMPIYYRTFPGNIPDSRSLETILTDLEHAGFKDIILVTDRGYETIRNLEKYILRGQPMIMCTKVQQKKVLEKIIDLGDFNTRPAKMTLDAQSRLYYEQYDIEYNVKSTGNSTKQSDRLKLNLYFDSIRRSEELLQLDIDIERQHTDLQNLLRDKAALESDATLKRVYSYFKLNYDKGTRVLTSYVFNDKKVAKARLLSGFFAITTHKLNMTGLETFNTYKLRDEQEKYFQQMKSQMACNRQRNWSEDGKTGRLFILFVSLIISSYLRNVWKSTILKELLPTSLDILDEMRSIRCIEHTNRAKIITPFVGLQVNICDAFGFEIPEGCSPKYVLMQKNKTKRGRPRKNSSEFDS